MIDKAAIVKEARQIFDARYPCLIKRQACVYMAKAFKAAAQKHGLDTILQAGTAMFQFQKDDGVTTHFSYVFDAEVARERLENGLLPELHAWNYVRTTGEIVDISTRYQAEQAKAMCGFIWQPEFALPDYLWTPISGITRRTIYHADLTACIIAENCIYKPTVSSTIPVALLGSCANMRCEDERK